MDAVTFTAGPVLQLDLERLEPCAGKPACTVLRRVSSRNAARLSDIKSSLDNGEKCYKARGINREIHALLVTTTG